MISAVIAIVQAKSKVTFIAQLMGVSWGALSGAFLAPFLYGLYWKKTSKAAVATSFCFGVCMMLIQLSISLGVLHVSGPFFGLVFKNSLYSGVFSMLASLIIVPVVSLISAKSRPAGVENMFDCYNTTVTVHTTEALTE